MDAFFLFWYVIHLWRKINDSFPNSRLQCAALVDDHALVAAVWTGRHDGSVAWPGDHAAKAAAWRLSLRHTFATAAYPRGWMIRVLGIVSGDQVVSVGILTNFLVESNFTPKLEVLRCFLSRYSHVPREEYQLISSIGLKEMKGPCSFRGTVKVL